MHPSTVVLAGLLCALSASPQQAEVQAHAYAYTLPPVIITANTQRVVVDVVARRPDGTPDDGLTRSNFMITDNGRSRALTSFSVLRAASLRSAPPPTTTSQSPATDRSASASRSVALFFDDVNTEGTDLQNARNAATRFVHEGLGHTDRVGIFTNSGWSEVNFTTDSHRLLTAIAALSAHPRATRRSSDCPHLTDFQAFQIANHRGAMALNAAVIEKKRCDEQLGIVVDDGSQIYNAGHTMAGYDNPSEEVLVTANALWGQARAAAYSTLTSLRNVIGLLAQQPGSRMLLLTSGGFLSGTLETLEDHIVQEALRDQVVINSLEARGLYTQGPGRPIDYVPDLMKLPIPTYAYEESSKLSEDAARDEAMADLAESTGGLFFHDNNDLTLGFDRLGLIPSVTYELSFAPSDIAHDGRFHKLKVEITPQSHDVVQARPGYFAPITVSGPGLQAQLDTAMRAGGSEAGLAVTVALRPVAGKVTVEMRLDAAHLPFQDQKGRHRLNLHFIAGLFDVQGKFVTGKEAEMDLALKDATWRRLVSHGLNTNLTLDAPSAAYTLRVVVATSPTALFATSLPLTIH